ncbi:hypothetical protein WICPIJ_005309 [Wickerhamomyces pijperi]|uniref:Golgi pH regulator n=1 Tax=Wickerhamomyces pijperi TaxID=599730 RepID=A0A9P8TM37_WICPI|nr:hypothetical protein WICPIJ_005309 [Wickerhamomyces pijperi]
MILLLLLTFALVFYYTYHYTYPNIIHFIESLTISRIQQTDLHTQPSSVNGLDHTDNKLLTSNREIRLLSKFVFSTNVTVTVLMIVSILAQFIYIDDQFDANDEYYSLWFWNLLLFTSVLCLVLIQPVLVFYSYNAAGHGDRNNTTTTVWVHTCLYSLVWICMISSFDWLTDLHLVYDGLIHTYLEKIGIIGISLIAFMNGLGSISSFYYCLYEFLMTKLYEWKDGKKSLSYGGKSVDQYESALSNLYGRLRSVEESIESKRAEEHSLDSATSKILSKRNGFRARGSIYDLKTLFGGAGKTNSGDLESEIRALETIRNDLSIKISKVSGKLDTVNNSGTLKYKMKLYTEKIFASYCLLRILQVSVSYLVSIISSTSPTKTSTSDPLIVTVVNIISIFITLAEEEIIINQLSFFISGVFFMFSLNGIYILLSHLYKFVPWNHHRITKPIKNLILSELFGIYTLSTFFILKSNLTVKFSEKLDHLLSITNNDFSMIDMWFDKVFLISVIVTFIGIKLNEYWFEFDDDWENELGVSSKQH